MLRSAVPWFAVLALAGTPTIALAQADGAADPASPAAVAEGYRERLVASDWVGAAALVHPTDLADFRSTLDTVAELEGGEAFVAEMMGPSADLGASSDAEVFGAYLAWIMAEDSGGAGPLEMMRTMEWRVGETQVDGDRAVVVSEVSFDIGGERRTMPDSTPLRLHAGEWRIDVSRAVTEFRVQAGLEAPGHKRSRLPIEPSLE